MYQIGVDEAGRGPAVGPLVVCALCIPSLEIEVLKDIGAKDSKSLTRKKRDLLAKKIYSEIEKRNWKVGIITCSASRVDKERELTNLNNLEVELFKEAIISTEVQDFYGEIYLDACDINEKRFGDRVSSSLGKDWSQWTIQSKHKI